MGWFDWIPSVSPLRRIRVDIDERWNIQAYGGRNLYPQEMHQILLRSPLVKKSVQVISDFISGQGFEKNTEQPVNEFGQNINDILDFASHDLSEYGGLALMLNLNGLGQAETVENIPFEYVRFGEPDNLGKHSDVKISNNWEQFSRELPQGSLIDPDSFPLWNPLTNTENGMKGQSVVLYYTGKNPHKYPLCTFDSVTNAAESDYSIQKYEVNQIANGFHGISLFRYPGQFESDGEKADLYNKLQEMQGVSGAGIFVLEVDEDVGNILETIPPSSSENFTATIDHVQTTIMSNYALPQVLLGINNSGSVFNEQALIDSFVIMNTNTVNARLQMARLFNSFGDFGDIIPREILRDEKQEEVVESVVEEVEEEEVVIEEETPEEEAA